LKLPNKTHFDSPVGGEDKNKVIKIVESKSKLPRNTKLSKQYKSHVEIAQQFDLLDFQNASKLTGNKFVFFKNEAAQLELALCNWALNLVAKRGYTPITTPDLARANIMEACGF